jgi:hypothetical protein
MAKSKKVAATDNAQKPRPVWSKGRSVETVTVGEGEYLSEITIQTLNYDVFTHCNMQPRPDELFFRLGIVSATNLVVADGSTVELTFDEYDINGTKYQRLSDDSWSFFGENVMVTIMLTNAIKKLSGLTVDDILALKFFRPDK